MHQVDQRDDANTEDEDDDEEEEFDDGVKIESDENSP